MFGISDKLFSLFYTNERLSCFLQRVCDWIIGRFFEISIRRHFSINK